MSGSTRAITLKLTLADAAKLQSDLKAAGDVGEQALARIEAAAQKAAGKGGNSGFGAMNTQLQSFGYQLQDTIVQIQGGTSALTALSQQGSQFLGSFGTGGAIAGAVLTIGALVAKFLEAGNSIEAIVKANKEWAASQEALNAILETGVEKAERLARAQLQNALAPQRTGLQVAQTDRETARQDIADLEKYLAELKSGSPRQVGANARNIAEAETQLASRRDDLKNAEERAAAAQRNIAGAQMLGPKPADYLGPVMDPATEALRAAAEARARAERSAGQRPDQAAITNARSSAMEEADRLGLLEGGDRQAERNKLIGDRVAAVTAQQKYATQQAADAEAKRAEAEKRRIAEALRGGDSLVNQAKVSLDLSQQLATAESPREAMLARQRAEIDRGVASLEAKKKAQQDPSIKVQIQDQIDDYKRLTAEAQKYQEIARGRAGLFQLGQAGERTAAYTKALGMSPNERARYLGEFSERQRIEASGDDVNSETSIARIKKAGDVAFGDEQFRKLQDFTADIQDMGAAFADAFGSAVSGGQKAGDILKTLERQLLSIATKTFITKPLENAFSGIAGQIGTSLFGSIMGGVAGSVTGSSSSGGAKAKFATGGIMTEFGPLPLRKYAGGGVARSPQVAIYGENRQPEAYVPLPDGRSIPVSMNGGGGGAVFNIDARGADAGVEMKIQAAIAQAAPHIVAASEANLTAKVNRGGAAAQTFGRRR